MDREEVHTGFWWENLTEGDHTEDSGVDGRIISKLIFVKGDGGINWIDLVQDTERWRGSCECGNELSGAIKCGEFLD